MRKSNTKRKPDPKSNVILFPAPTEPVDPFLSEMARVFQEGDKQLDTYDIADALTFGQEGCVLYQLPEGLRLDGPDGQPIWRMFRVTN